MDSGRNYRSFLPYISETGRASLRSYDGPASVTQTQVVCFAPRFEKIGYAERGVDVPVNGFIRRAVELSVDGEWSASQPQVSELKWELIKPVSATEESWGTSRTTFNCTMPYLDPSSSAWPMSLCSVHFTADFKYDAAFNGSANYTSIGASAFDKWRGGMRQYLVLNSTMT